ncbi:MAG: hypothetical protein ACI4U0_05560 [Candidatus Aphodocola sp.]
MGKLENLNDEVFERIKFIDKDLVLSNPLLVTSNSKGKILYLGQETNTWCGSHENYNSARELEFEYDNYFLNDKMSNTLFWKYIREVTGYHDVARKGNITWANLFICGNKDCKGTPVLYNDIKDLSVYYLSNVVDILNIDKIISVVGPKNPYYEAINRLASELGCIINEYPTIRIPYAYSDNEKIFYTYHPMYLQKSKNFSNVVKVNKEFISK